LEHGARVFENRVLRKTFGYQKDEATGERRRLQSEELHALYSSPDIKSGDQDKKNEIGRECSIYREKERCI
jgi:hypothetical protein